MNDRRAYLMDCQRVLLEEIACREANQVSIARTYRMALETTQAGLDVVNWKTVNTAIIARWSLAGLERIKILAWSGKCFSEAKP